MEKLLTKINEKEAARYLGCSIDPIPNNMMERIKSASDLILEKAKPRYIYHIFMLSKDGSYLLEDTNFSLIGNDIKKHLTDCHACILMAATLGQEIDQIIRRAQITDMAQAVTLDTCASAAIENVCDNAEDLIIKENFKEDLYYTSRFSPGYGDMPLTLQQDFCRLLDTPRKIGLSVSEGGLMTPLKSVTAIIGISHHKVKKYYGGCDTCPIKETCTYHKGGQTCGRKTND